MSDPSEEIIDAVQEFLAVVEAESLTLVERVLRLRLSLDRLAYLQRFCGEQTDPLERADPPTQDYQALRAEVAAQFQGLASYRLPTPIARIGGSEIEVADSIDDITDIASELYDVAWRAKHTGADDAVWHFRNGFTVHWGEHLRGLQVYLHRLVSKPKKPPPPAKGGTPAWKDPNGFGVAGKGIESGRR